MIQGVARHPTNIWVGVLDSVFFVFRNVKKNVPKISPPFGRHFLQINMNLYGYRCSTSAADEKIGFRTMSSNKQNLMVFVAILSDFCQK